MRRLMLATWVLAATATAPPALAFDSLDDVRCACADGALGPGDYASCVAHLSRRLVAQGVLDERERSRAIAEASREDPDAASAACGRSGWSIGLVLDSAFVPFGRERMGGAIALRNGTPDAVELGTGSCSVTTRILDLSGRVVRDADSCALVVLTTVLEPGDSIEGESSFRLQAWDADPATGLVNRRPLPAGAYVLEATVHWHGPNRPGSAEVPPLVATASLAFRIEP